TGKGLPLPTRSTARSPARSSQATARLQPGSSKSTWSGVSRRSSPGNPAGAAPFIRLAALSTTPPTTQERREFSRTYTLCWQKMGWEGRRVPCNRSNLVEEAKLATSHGRVFRQLSGTYQFNEEDSLCHPGLKRR